MAPTSKLDIQLVRKLMKQRHLSQRDLAGMAGVTEAAMSRYLAGERLPRADKIANMATALGATSDVLLGRSESEEEIDKAIRLVARNAEAIPKRVKEALVAKLMEFASTDMED